MAPSREESLRELLTRVHERLSRAATVDQESRRLLATLTEDIERTLGSPRRESVSKLESLAARFDAEHPALAQTLRQLVDFLGKGGI
jgi:hypothetical protein